MSLLRDHLILITEDWEDVLKADVLVFIKESYLDSDLGSETNPLVKNTHRCTKLMKIEESLHESFSECTFYADILEE